MTDFIVTTLVDENDSGASAGAPGGSGLSLREAIALAQAGDVVTFRSDLAGGVIDLTLGQLEIEKPFPIGTAPITIDGDLNDDRAPDITIDAQGSSRVIEIAADVDLVGGSLVNTPVTLDGLVVTGGRAASDAGIQVRGTDFTLQNSRVENNQADVSGGGIGINNTFGGPRETDYVILNSMISDNVAADGAGIIFRRAELTIVNSTISDNVASGGFVGGIRGFDARPLTMVNSTVSGNSVTGDNASVGAISVSSGFASAPVTLDNVTITGNTATGAGATTGGVRSFGEPLIVRNSIVAGNAANGIVSDVGDPVTTSNGANAFSQGAVSGALVGDQLGVDPAALFAAVAQIGSTGVFAGVLADNGGPTLTIALAPGGPAVDAGGLVTLLEPGPDRVIGTPDDVPIAFDQRGPGFDRSVTGIDLGAFEFQNAVVLFTPAADVIDLNDFDLTASSNSTDALAGADVVTLSEQQNLGVAFFGGSGGDTVFGAGVGDDIRGGRGADTLFGRIGEDLLYGGDQNDRLFGGDGSDDLFGGRGDDRLFGGSGDDALGSRDDTLDGGAGADVLTGRAGRDVLLGGAGNDRFDFDAVSDTAFRGRRDRIEDFEGVGRRIGDRIDLDGIDAIEGGGDNAFDFVGTAGFTARGQMRVFDQGGDTVVAANTAGGRRAEFQMVVENVAAAAWREADFVL